MLYIIKSANRYNSQCLKRKLEYNDLTKSDFYLLIVICLEL